VHGQHLARRVRSSELGGNDGLAGGAGPPAFLARLGLIRRGSAALLARLHRVVLLIAIGHRSAL